MASTSDGIAKVMLINALWMAVVMDMVTSTITAQNMKLKMNKNLIVLEDSSVPVKTAALTFEAPTRCSCKITCMTSLPCQHAVARVSEENQVVCHLFNDPFIYASVSEENGSKVFYWTEYTPHGNGGQFYHIYTEEQAKWNPASGRCQNEGGQLAVADTEQKMTDLIQLLNLHQGIKHWIGLYRTMEENDAGMPPSWEYRSGFRVRLDDNRLQTLEDHGRCFLILPYDNSTTKLENSETCGALLPFVCQRDY